ncbi:MAG TPA: hypothetical protein VKA70_21765 [Blastocatellia bacterium]|nr:hypothetical protein [Blastocatellia bacterium]
MKKTTLALILFVLLAGSAVAQRGTSIGDRMPIDSRSRSTSGQYGARTSAELEHKNGMKSPAGLATLFFAAEVLKAHPENRQIEIRRKSDKSEHMLALAPDCKIKADEKQFGKKELSLDEIEPGYKVELLVELKTNMITQMKVKKPKA